MFFCNYRQDGAMRQILNYKFTQSQKSGFSSLSGVSLDRFTSNWARPTATNTRIVQRFSGCMFFFCNYRQEAARRQNLNFIRQKSGFFAPQCRLVAPIHIKLGTTDAHLGPLICTKVHLNSAGSGNAAPKVSKISTFGKE